METDVDLDDIDHECTPTAVCPWCGHRHEDCDEWHSDIDGDILDHERDKCGKPFQVEVNITVSYSTMKVYAPADPA